jgi:hypothetical protein
VRERSSHRFVASLRSVEDRVPFKSQAQRRKFAQLLVEGKISPDTFEEWNRETGGAKLPERAHKKKPSASRPSRKRKSKPKPGARRKSAGKGR